MKRIFQSSGRLYSLSNIFVCILCTGYLCTGYYNINNNVHYEKEDLQVETETEPLSEKKEEKANNNSKVITISKANTASKKYVKASYDAVTGNAVVEYAKKYLGLRYVRGGNSLSTGTDCSGFTKLIYKEFGINLSRAVSGQRYAGRYVQKSDLQKGDLIFYGTKAGVASHVAIYIGNGQVIHQSTPKHGVKINSMNMMVYITARRVITERAKVLESETNTNNTSETNADINSNVNDTTEINNGNINNEIENNTINENVVKNENNNQTNNVNENIDIYTKSEYGTSN